MSRAYTAEELRDLLLDQMRFIARYWANLKENKTVLERIEGAIFNVLVILDGHSSEIPTFDLVVKTNPEDKQYYINNKENWIEDGTTLSFLLHEHWYKKDIQNKAATFIEVDNHCGFCPFHCSGEISTCNLEPGGKYTEDLIKGVPDWCKLRKSEIIVKLKN